jgi:hypothetical protein
LKAPDHLGDVMRVSVDPGTETFTSIDLHRAAENPDERVVIIEVRTFQITVADPEAEDRWLRVRSPGPRVFQIDVGERRALGDYQCDELIPTILAT